MFSSFFCFLCINTNNIATKNAFLFFFFSSSIEGFKKPLHFCANESRDVIWPNDSCPDGFTYEYTLYGGTTETNNSIAVYNGFSRREDVLKGVLHDNTNGFYNESTGSFVFYVPGTVIILNWSRNNISI